MNMDNPMSVISSAARIADNAKIGCFCVIEDDVVIRPGCVIGHHVVIRAGSILGPGVQVGDHTVIGKPPFKAALSATTKIEELPPCELGENVVLGAHVIIYRGCKLATKVFVADFASIRENVTVGEMTIIGRGVTIENKCKVGSRCKIETEAYVCAMSDIGDGCFVAPEVTFTNDNFMARWKERFKYHKGVTMLRGARIGANATILPGRTIHEDGVVAAGSIVTKDVPAKKIVLGSPAKVLRDVPPEQLLDNQ
jgi:UDP-2-acetamido-3-amino-2,3-dideoxy-glucuronate N-acetyltransferase